MRDDAVLGRALPLDRGLGPQVSNNTQVHFACMQSMHDIAKHQNMSHLYVTTNSYNVTHAQYQQRGGIMLLSRTADLVIVLMKLL